MYVNKLGVSLAFVLLVIGTLACDVTTVVDQFIAQATATATKTPRPTFTPLATITNTPAPTNTATRVPPTEAPTKAPTARPPTARPATAAPKPTAVKLAPTVSAYEFHANPPTCTHSGKTFIKGTVYLDKNDPSQRYVGAIVALGSPDGSIIYVDPVKTNDYGEYTFILSDEGSRPGTWGVWLVDPAHKRKSDVGGPITTNNLGPDNPSACWAAGVDFWK
ncbi:MAG: hypothetical protein HZB51_22420 [Chloroflexi bacterium]|nr:hypothetical protein [Chloroflexota bacterium]